MAKKITIDVPMDEPTNVTIEATGFQGTECRKATQPIREGFGHEIISDTATAETKLVPLPITPQILNAKS